MQQIMSAPTLYKIFVQSQLQSKPKPCLPLLQKRAWLKKKTAWVLRNRQKLTSRAWMLNKGNNIKRKEEKK